MIGGGPRKNDIYFFLSDSLPHVKASTFMSGSLVLSHYKYGYYSLKKDFTSQSLPYLVCLLQSVSHFSEVSIKGCHILLVTHKHIVHPIALVHSDVCGPIKELNQNRSCYFISYVDDYPSMIWIYLLNSQELFLKPFHQEIKVQFSCNIQVFQSNTALEYIEHVMYKFCGYAEMIHNISCPCTFPRWMDDHRNI